MEHEHERRVTGPSGTLAQRVGDHVASANQLLQQSRRAVERLRARQWYRLANEELAEFEARFEGGGKAGPAA